MRRRAILKTSSDRVEQRDEIRLDQVREIRDHGSSHLDHVKRQTLQLGDAMDQAHAAGIDDTHLLWGIVDQEAVGEAASRVGRGLGLLAGVIETEASIENRVAMMEKGYGIILEGHTFHLEALRSLQGELIKALETANDVVSGKPSWNSATGELMFNGSCVRKVARQAGNVCRILDQFESSGWPQKVSLEGGSWDPQRMRETVRTLNVDLLQIRFFSANGCDDEGRRSIAVAWAVENSRATPAHLP